MPEPVLGRRTRTIMQHMPQQHAEQQHGQERGTPAAPARKCADDRIRLLPIKGLEAAPEARIVAAVELRVRWARRGTPWR
eukprot:13617208-Alexandrium_andersonii.AAC.1